METQKREAGKAGKERQANLELLRIFSMLMIVMMHLLNHGKILETTARGSISYYLVWILFGISCVSISTYIPHQRLFPLRGILFLPAHPEAGGTGLVLFCGSLPGITPAAAPAL